MSSATFTRFAQRSACWLGSAWMFLGSVLACGVWLALGAAFQWGELWHLIPTSILTWTTWLLAVLIQHEQSVATKAIQTKLDAIIVGLEHVNNSFVGLETQGEEAIEALHESVQATVVAEIVPCEHSGHTDHEPSPP